MTNAPENNKQIDTTISEIHAVRRALSGRFSGNIKEIAEDARMRQQQSGRQVLSRNDLAQISSGTETGAECL